MKKIVIVLILFTTVVSCSPSLDYMKKEITNFELPHHPQKGKAIVYIIRPDFFGLFTKTDVSIDDIKIGHTRSYQYIYANVTPGDHIITSQPDNMINIDPEYTIARYKINTKSGDIIFIYQKVIETRSNIVNSLNYVSDIQGKYYLQQTTLGTLFIKNDIVKDEKDLTSE